MPEEIDNEFELDQCRSEIQDHLDTIASLELELMKKKKEAGPDAQAVQWLKENCLSFQVQGSQSGYSVEGTISSKEGGYVTQYVPRIVRRNERPPYIIHKDDTYKIYREIDFKEYGDSINGAVKKVQESLPGDVEINKQPFEENREAVYGSGGFLWVQPCSDEISLKQFRELKEVGEDPNLSDPHVRNRKAPGR